MSARRRPLVLISVSTGTFVVLALLLALRWSAEATLPSRGEAVQEVRVLLKSRVNIRYLAALDTAGIRRPDAAMAERWDRELRHLDAVEIVDPQLAIPLPAYLLGWPGYMVRVKVDDELRYFHVRPDGSSERSVWSWWFAW